MKKQLLYAWADKTNLGVGDHTWVSTYSPANGRPDTEKGDYWYCWGDIHNNAICLGAGVGGASFAKSIALPHDKKADAGILYAKDGVCHQIANRLLRFSFDKNGNPITVKGAKGYQLTKAMYGEYGEKARTDSQIKRYAHWENNVNNYKKETKND
ncbi:hypothetical protein [Aeromonas dhakensis]|uniref:hypothetical protein n=1 Tax=Aeromonas dhakensis TaxID=196024 RepID=UPI003EC6A0C0